MRVQHDRVGAREAAEGRTPARGEREESSVGGIGVQPESLVFREVRERVEIVDRAGVRRARALDDEERREPGGTVLGHAFPKGVETHAERSVGRNLADVRAGEAREERGLADAVVALVGDVERALEEVLGQPLVPRRDDGGEVRERPARRQESAGALRVAHGAREPANYVRLELDERRCRGEDAHVAVHGRRDEVRGGGVGLPASGDVREKSRPGVVEARGDRLLEQQVEKRSRGRAVLGWLPLD